LALTEGTIETRDPKKFKTNYVTKLHITAFSTADACFMKLK